MREGFLPKNQIFNSNYIFWIFSLLSWSRWPRNPKKSSSLDFLIILKSKNNFLRISMRINHLQGSSIVVKSCLKHNFFSLFPSQNVLTSNIAAPAYLLNPKNLNEKRTKLRARVFNIDKAPKIQKSLVNKDQWVLIL